MSDVLSKLEFLTKSQLQDIEFMARGLTLDQCFDCLKILKSAVPVYDMEVAEMYHRAGVASGLNTAFQELFGQMKMKGGDKAAIAYLVNAGAMTEDSKAIAAASGKSTFSMNIIYPGKDKKHDPSQNPNDRNKAILSNGGQ